MLTQKNKYCRDNQVKKHDPNWNSCPWESRYSWNSKVQKIFNDVPLTRFLRKWCYCKQTIYYNYISDETGNRWPEGIPYSATHANWLANITSWKPCLCFRKFQTYICPSIRTSINFQRYWKNQFLATSTQSLTENEIQTKFMNKS